MDNMLREALRKNSALRQQLENLLLGDDGDIWEAELKKFVAKRPCWMPYVIRPADFDPATFQFHKGWIFSENDTDYRSLALSEVDFSKVLLETCLEEDESSITGEKKLWRLKSGGNIRLDPRFAVALFREKGHKILEYLYKERGVACLGFFGRILVDPNGCRYAIYLLRNVAGWEWRIGRLNDYWSAQDFSVRLPS